MTTHDVRHTQAGGPPLQDWVGRTEQCTDLLTQRPADALAATLDRDDGPYSAGTALPALWHWLYFLDIFKLQDAGYDGHAALGRFLPPVPLPRRMWAGSRLTWHAPMQIGQSLTKTSEILSVQEKTGRSGPLVFVTVAHRFQDAGTLCLSEEHDIVYRGHALSGADAAAQPPAPHKAPQSADFSRTITPSPVLLFRYSALTFNGHRIHYDRSFCEHSEGYGGLVVHGPLLATLMLDLLRRQTPQARLTSFTFRAQAPVLDTDAFDVQGALRSATSADLWITRHDGTEAMRGFATWDTAEHTS